MSLLSMFLACGSSEPTGQVVFSSSGTTDAVSSWIVPAGITEIHVVVVGGSANVASNIQRGATTLISTASAIGANFGGGSGGYGFPSNGGGGAAGYSGNGGEGRPAGAAGTAGAGGAGGGGSNVNRGGGVGLQGQGTSGGASSINSPGNSGSAPGPFFGAGKSGEYGGNLRYTVTPIAVTAGETLTITAAKRSTAADSVTGGAVRIMWGGGRSYPYNAGDM